MVVMEQLSLEYSILFAEKKLKLSSVREVSVILGDGNPEVVVGALSLFAPVLSPF